MPVVSVITIDGVKLALVDDSWLMFRASGTEPLLRIYAEATSVRLLEQLLSLGEKMVRERTISHLSATR